MVQGLLCHNFSNSWWYNETPPQLRRPILWISLQYSQLYYGTLKSGLVWCVWDYLQPIIKWPARDELLLTMPMSLRRNFKSSFIIIGCFEVFIESPTSLKPKAQTWSNYKQHNTIKFFIGIVPQKFFYLQGMWWSYFWCILDKELWIVEQFVARVPFTSW